MKHITSQSGLLLNAHNAVKHTTSLYGLLLNAHNAVSFNKLRFKQIQEESTNTSIGTYVTHRGTERAREGEVSVQ